MYKKRMRAFIELNYQLGMRGAYRTQTNTAVQNIYLYIFI